MSSPITALEGLRWWLARDHGNGLTEDTWVPMWCVDSRVVGALLAELRRAGVPARCTRLTATWRLPPTHPGEWCLWVGYDTYWRAEERLTEVMPLLVRSLRRTTGTP